MEEIKLNFGFMKIKRNRLVIFRDFEYEMKFFVD